MIGKFIERIFLFISLLLILSAALLILYTVQLRSDAVNKTKAIIALGDSHFQNGIISDENVANFSNSGEAYVYSYWKLKYILNHTEDVQKVLLAYSNHNIQSEIDSLWNFSENSILEKYGTYWALADYSDLVIYHQQFCGNFKMFVSMQSKVLSNSIYSIERQIILHKLPFYGGYTENSNLLDTATLEPRSTKESGLSHSNIQVYYLDKIIQLCKEKQIELFLVNTPVYNNHDSLDLHPLIQENNIVLLNYADSIQGAENFADQVHLNPKGAARFSLMLSNYFKKEQ